MELCCSCAAQRIDNAHLPIFTLRVYLVHWGYLVHIARCVLRIDCCTSYAWAATCILDPPLVAVNLQRVWLARRFPFLFFFSLFPLFHPGYYETAQFVAMEGAPAPRRSLMSIQPLPSIYTAFPSHYTRIQSSSALGESNSSRVEDGLEVVPLERCSILSAPILSPWHAEKEVCLTSHKELIEKPLPQPPRSLWKIMSVKYRVISLLGLQAAVLITIGLALLSVKRHNSSRFVNFLDNVELCSYASL